MKAYDRLMRTLRFAARSLAIGFGLAIVATIAFGQGTPPLVSIVTYQAALLGAFVWARHAQISTSGSRV